MSNVIQLDDYRKRCTHCGARVKLITLTCPDCGNQQFVAQRDFELLYEKTAVNVRRPN